MANAPQADAEQLAATAQTSHVRTETIETAGSRNRQDVEAPKDWLEPVEHGISLMPGPPTTSSPISLPNVSTEGAEETVSQIVARMLQARLRTRLEASELPFAGKCAVDILINITSTDSNFDQPSARGPSDHKAPAAGTPLGGDRSAANDHLQPKDSSECREDPPLRDKASSPLVRTQSSRQSHSQLTALQAAHRSSSFTNDLPIRSADIHRSNDQDTNYCSEGSAPMDMSTPASEVPFSLQSNLGDVGGSNDVSEPLGNQGKKDGLGGRVIPLLRLVDYPSSDDGSDEEEGHGDIRAIQRALVDMPGLQQRPEPPSDAAIPSSLLSASGRLVTLATELPPPATRPSLIQFSVIQVFETTPFPSAQVEPGNIPCTENGTRGHITSHDTDHASTWTSEATTDGILSSSSSPEQDGAEARPLQTPSPTTGRYGIASSTLPSKLVVTQLPPDVLAKTQPATELSTQQSVSSISGKRKLDLVSFDNQDPPSPKRGGPGRTIFNRNVGGDRSGESRRFTVNSTSDGVQARKQELEKRQTIARTTVSTDLGLQDDSSVVSLSQEDLDDQIAAAYMASEADDISEPDAEELAKIYSGSKTKRRSRGCSFYSWYKHARLSHPYKAVGDPLDLDADFGSKESDACEASTPASVELHAPSTGDPCESVVIDDTAEPKSNRNNLAADCDYRGECHEPPRANCKPATRPSPSERLASESCFDLSTWQPRKVAFDSGSGGRRYSVDNTDPEGDGIDCHAERDAPYRSPATDTIKRKATISTATSTLPDHQLDDTEDSAPSTWQIKQELADGEFQPPWNAKYSSQAAKIRTMAKNTVADRATRELLIQLELDNLKPATRSRHRN